MLRGAGLAAALVVTAAVFGAITVKLLLNPYVIVVHLALAMTLLAVLSTAVLRAGGWGFDGSVVASPKTYRAARVAAIMAFVVVVMGALTANVAGANVSCGGFPWCRWVALTGGPLYMQVTHRVIAFLLLFHVFGLVMALRKRDESRIVGRSAALALAAIVLQIIVAAALVETGLPPVWRSLHQATGTLVWLAVFTFAVLAKYASSDATALGARAT